MLAAIVLVGCSEARPIRPADIDVPRGFKIEAAVRDLAAPTMVAFDDQGRMLIAESGYRGGGKAASRPAQLSEEERWEQWRRERGGRH